MDSLWTLDVDFTMLVLENETWKRENQVKEVKATSFDGDLLDSKCYTYSLQKIAFAQVFSLYENVYVCMLYVELVYLYNAIKCILCFEELNRHFKNSFRFTAKLEGRYKDFSYIFCPYLPH